MVRPQFLALLLMVAAALVSCRGGARPSSLEFIPERLPEAHLGQSYGVTVEVVANRTPVGSMSVAEGSLPPGLELRHGAGRSAAEIVGVPREAGEYRFTLEASCLGTNEHGQVGRREWTISVR